MKERIDKAKNKAKVIKELMKDPLQTEREVAKKVGIGNGTAHRLMKDVEQNGAKSEAIERIISKDAVLVELTQEELENRVKNNKEDVSTRDLISIGDVSAKRYSIFRGSITDDEGGMKIREEDLED